MTVDFTTIIDLLGLEEAGPGALIVCPLPEHADTQASLKIWTEEGRFYCFGCEARGDFLDFYAEVRGLSKDDATAEIEKLTGERLSPPKEVPRGPEVEARGVGEKALSPLRETLPGPEHAVLGERLDKICWAYRKQLIDSEQLAGAVRRFVRELPVVP